MNANDREYMGTPEAAKEALIAKARSWREYRQPMIATAKEHKRIETLEREAKFQLANAALLWLWHEENPQAPQANCEPPQVSQQLRQLPR